MLRAPRSSLRSLFVLAAGAMALCGAAGGASPYTWKAGPSNDPNWFPISVWWQSYMTSREANWAGIGINQYVTPDSPTSTDQNTLRTYHNKTIINYNASLRGSNVVTGWLQPDEPDNAQWNATTQTYDPCIDPNVIIAAYNTMKAADPNRPVFLGLGQGVCWPTNNPYYGRGNGSSWAQYPLYCQGGDIIAFDVYPYNTASGDPMCNKPWYVAIGVDRLKSWTNNSKPIWVDIETNDINGSGHPPKPYQTKGEVWMALVHGVSGIQYFAQTWKREDPNIFNREDGTFSPDPNYADPGMVSMLRTLNAQIEHYSKQLYAPAIRGLWDCNQPVNWVEKQYGSMTYIFAVSLWDDPNVKSWSFTIPGLPASIDANVMDEGRKVTLTNGTFTDNFSSLSVHIYEIAALPEPATAALVLCGAAWLVGRRRRRWRGFPTRDIAPGATGWKPVPQARKPR